MKQYTVLIVGMGKRGMHHGAAFNANPRFKVTGICDIDEDDLRPDRRIGELGIDSILAGEIMAQAELALGIDIDFRKVRDDWSTLTIQELASELWNQPSGGDQ